MDEQVVDLLARAHQPDTSLPARRQGVQDGADPGGVHDPMCLVDRDAQCDGGVGVVDVLGVHDELRRRDLAAVVSG